MTDALKEFEQQAEEKARVEDATTMLSDGMDHQMVAKYSHLPLKKVKELAQSLSA